MVDTNETPAMHMVLCLLGSAVSWAVLSGVVSFAALFVTGQIPFLGVGMGMATLGGITHAVLIILGAAPKWWVIGAAFSMILTAVFVVLGTLSGNRFPPVFVVFFVVFFFVFSSMIYAVVQKFIVEGLIDDE